MFDGVVTRGLRSNGGSSSSSNNNSKSSSQQRDEPHGLIEITTKATEDDSVQESVSDEAAASTAKTIRRTVVRYTNESVNPVVTGAKQEDNAETAEDSESANGATAASGKPQRRSKKPVVPHYGDEVRFRIATHKKSGVKRAVELIVTASAKAKLEKELEVKLLTMTRELGVVERMKAGGGFIKCCDRLEELHFPLHEIRASDIDEQLTKAEATGGDEASASTETSEKKPKTKQPGKKQALLREGDEVSFFVYEERDEQDSPSRSRPRLTALRVQKVAKGTVTFEELVRSNVQGVVAKSPKEPRNGPEVIGSITATASGTAAAAGSGGENKVDTVNAPVAAETEIEAVVPGSPKPKSKKPAAKGESKKKTGSTATGIPFRLSDAHDMSYSPIVGDVVLFDEVFEKRSGKHKAVNVRVVTLNPKNREQGVITSVREDFGFIKCADRAMDAFFRFGDVMTAHRDFRLGTEVAFDVNFDPTKPENARATRVEILKHGTVQWESVVEDGLLGEVIAVPASSRNNGASGGGRSGNAKPSIKSTNGRIRLAPSCTKRFWLEFLPELKQKIDGLFLLGPNEEVPAVVPAVEQQEEQSEEAQQATEDKDKSGNEKKMKHQPKKNAKKEIKLLFPSTLAKAERFAIHEYCDFLGITHQSTGDGPNRRLELVASHKIPAKAIVTEDNDSLLALELEFKSDDLAEIRYTPRVGDRVKFKLMRSNRTKQFSCKAVVCVEAAAGGPASKSKKKMDEKKEGTQRDEGFIVAVRSEGFGFIRPADISTNTSNSAADENLFFHIKEVTTGETLESLKEGMEVQYTTSFDEVKKKTRAISIAVVPAGTIKKVEPEILRGVVSRPSFLHPMKSSKANRFSKNNNGKQATSTVGKIRVVTEGGEAGATGEDDDDAEDGEDQDDNTTGDEAEAQTGEAGEASTAATESTEPTEAKKPKAKAPKSKRKESMYTFNIKDIVDQSIVLREGDEVEFAAINSSKGLRASKIRVLKRYPKQGVVAKILEDFSGLIRMDAADGEEVDKAESLDIPFLARNVLRGDVLSEGDRVEFAHSLKKPSTTRKIGTAAAAATKAEAETNTEDETGAESPAATTAAEAQEKAEEPEKAFVGQATSVLRLSAATGGADSRTRAPRTVNSTLLQAMRQVGASAVVASRMAKGPDGTRGFKDGWRSAAGESTTIAAAVTEPATST